MRRSNLKPVKQPPEIFFSAKEIGRFLGVDKSVVLDWVRDGRFENVFRCPGKTGDIRIPNSAYQKFLQAQTEVAI